MRYMTHTHTHTHTVHKAISHHALTLQLGVMAERILCLGHADWQLVKAHASVLLDLRTCTQSSTRSLSEAKAWV